MQGKSLSQALSTTSPRAFRALRPLTYRTLFVETQRQGEAVNPISCPS
jgi:hypothetical protein